MQDWSAHSWAVYFSSQESPFHVWSFRLQSSLGLGFTMWVAKELKRLLGSAPGAGEAVPAMNGGG